MKSLNKIITAAALVTFATFANAQIEGYTPVVDGEAATAASVNDNFDALITVIDDLTEDVAALLAEVESLGGSPSNVTLADIVDNNYCISYFGNVAQSTDGSFASIESYVGSVKLAITSTSTATMTVVHDENFELGWHVDGGDPPELVAVVNSGSVDNPGDVVQGTNLSLTAGLLSVTLGGDVQAFNLSPDGNTMLGTNFDSTGTTDAETNVIIGMRCI